MNPSLQPRTSNLFKQGRTVSDMRSSVLYEDQQAMQDEDDYDIALIDMQNPEKSVVVSGERGAEPAQTSFAKDGRRTATAGPRGMTRLQSQTVYNLNPNSTSHTNLTSSDSNTKVGASQKLR